MEKTNLDLFFEEKNKDLGFRAAYKVEGLLQDLRDELRKARESKGMTQKELAGALRSTQSAVSNLENVNSPIYPSLLTLAKVADILGLELEVKLK